VIKVYNAEECQSVKPSGLSRAQLEARNTTLDELIEHFRIMSDQFGGGPVMESASNRLAHVSAALSCLEDSLFYVRMYRSADNTGEGERRRQQLIDDSELIINLIRSGGLYP
jgi:hypothetical protein